MPRVELGRTDTLIHRGIEVDPGVLDAIVTASNKRLLWAFVRKDGRVMAVPYSEERVIWMSAEDVLQPDEVEI